VFPQKLQYSKFCIVSKNKIHTFGLDDPVEGTNTPLVHVLFDMMPTFVRGNNPHFPMKKILLITWKILLTILGGFDALRKEKAQKRRDSGLPPMEDTLEVAAKLKPTRISEGDAAIRNCKI
jgi:hypothetical protein